MAVLTDKLLDKLFRFVEAQVGMQNVLVVLTADHGAAPVPEVSIQRKIGGGRMPPTIVQDTAQAAVDQQFGKARWILSASPDSIYLDRDLIRQKKHLSAEVERVAAEAVRTVPHVARVYTREQLTAGGAMADDVGRRVQNGFNTVRGADLTIVLEPYWIYGAQGTAHGTPYNYDTHVPIIFMGAGIKPGRYNKRAAPNDIAPTLATMLDVEIPSGSAGRVLDEILTER